MNALWAWVLGVLWFAVWLTFAIIAFNLGADSQEWRSATPLISAIAGLAPVIGWFYYTWKEDS